KDQDAKQPDAPLEDLKLPEHPTRTIVLGSEDPKTGFGLKVTLSSIGAGIASAELNDPRYKALKAPKHGAPVPQLSLLGNNLHDELQPLKTSPPVTGHLSVEEIDQRLAKLDKNADLRHINWNVAEIAEDADVKGVNASATFSFKTPDGRWELRKKYELLRWENALASRDDDPTGYQLAMRLSFKNLSNDEQTVVYDLQGPVGLPLENAEHTSKYRDVKYGFRNANGNFTTGALTTGAIVKDFDKNQLEELKTGERTFQYVGLDTQYFAALVLPQDVANKQPNYVDFAKAQVVEKNVALPNWSELSLQLHSVECAVPAETELRHDYRLYLGPKRTALLSPLDAAKAMDFGWFAVISNGMLWVLNGFYGFGLPYGICIMLLTVLVRSCMFPISKKQANNAKKMKELQPKIAELKTKYGDDKQKIAQAQMELFAQHGFNPLGGCLPLFLQLPIFIGLYQALSSSVDLRRAPFLWFDNLAAPDSLFDLPFTLPLLGNEFNLLPIITTSLFLFQQKMLMPPPTDEQTRMQAKMFFWMTLLMGFMFYHVPAGLCVYFIASSVWSMAERKLLDYGKGGSSVVPSSSLPAAPKNGEPTKPTDGFWGRLAARLEEIGELKDVNGIPVSGQRRPKDKDKKKPHKFH
ncbi:MAG TPA: YidC/Oxa1 family insertase periplasmic-domain containing protein, partial [Planctomycetaceae bacterium]|nr:YidC/Oxa1 family insertase periplasmic-domain containing protein [Planctomycetaceae bacterium]